MRPLPIPDGLLWPGARKAAIGPPLDHDQALLEILPVEAIIDQATEHIPRYHIMIAVDGLDLDLLKARGWFWLVFYGGVSPFDVAHPERDDLLDVEKDQDQEP